MNTRTPAVDPAVAGAGPRPTSGSALAVDVLRAGRECIVSLAGELDVATGPLVVLVGGDLVAKGARTIVLDLAEVRFCDSRGLAALHDVAVSLRARGGLVTLRSPSVRVTSLLHLLGMGATLPIELRTPEPLPTRPRRPAGGWRTAVVTDR